MHQAAIALKAEQADGPEELPKLTAAVDLLAREARLALAERLHARTRELTQRMLPVLDELIRRR